MSPAMWLGRLQSSLPHPTPSVSPMPRGGAGPGLAWLQTSATWLLGGLGSGGQRRGPWRLLGRDGGGWGPMAAPGKGRRGRGAGRALGGLWEASVPLPPHVPSRGAQTPGPSHLESLWRQEPASPAQGLSHPKCSAWGGQGGTEALRGATGGWGWGGAPSMQTPQKLGLGDWQEPRESPIRGGLQLRASPEGVPLTQHGDQDG